MQVGKGLKSLLPEWGVHRASALAFVRARSLVSFAVVLGAVPALVDLMSSPTRAPYHWIAADTFYYLTVARNWVRHGTLAYDGVHPSNGFHPLWQGWACITEWLREHLHLGAVGPFLLALTGVFLISATIWLLGLTLLRARRLSLLFLALPVGVYALSVLPAWVAALRVLRAHQNLGWLFPLFGTLWSYVNGMESALVLFFFALSLFWASEREALVSPRRAACVGAALAGLVLARLDHGFFAAPLSLGYAILCLRAAPAVRGGFSRRVARILGGLRQPMIAGSVAAACVLPYLLYNKHSFGHYVPLSGVAKSTFPHFLDDNLQRVLDITRHRLGIDSDWWLPVAARQLQTVVPALFAAAYIAVRALRPSRTPLTTLLTASALGALVLAAYNFCFTTSGDQGYWYMPVSTLLPSLFVLNARPLRLRLRSARAWPLAAALGAGVIAFFCLWHRHPSYNRDFRGMMVQTGAEVRAHYAGQVPKILEIDDGVVGYALDTPATSSYLGLDPEGFRAFKEGRLLDLALTRGFDHVGSSFYHPYDFSEASLTGWVSACLHQDMTHFRVEKEYFSSDGLVLIAKVTRR